jgi:hypothetical protein
VAPVAHRAPAGVVRAFARAVDVRLGRPAPRVLVGPSR